LYARVRKRKCAANSPDERASAISRESRISLRSCELPPLTRPFIEEVLFFPFAPHDDLIDGCSRIYDMQPAAASKWERAEWEPPVHPDA
jgi:hypothetical protein